MLVKNLNYFKISAFIISEKAAGMIVKDLKAKKFIIWLKILSYKLPLFFTKKIAK
ncbi:MAG: hypothetical protein KGQ36_06060 [Rickettsiales bacterium]|nr:hypothetical protein [Rickettsiales bacterium]